ncbi:MAG: RidA family protein [Alphaproteobacteria bacterium]|nr:RidA family protein [Alphaproteobacteria bacterium]
MEIKRGPESFPGRTRRVEYNGLVHVVMSAPDGTGSMAGQTQRCLDGVDALLAEAGTDKSRLVTATIYLSDMARKSEMNDVWVAWADRDNPCARVCVGATFEPRNPPEELLIEIAISAAIG